MSYSDTFNKWKTSYRILKFPRLHIYLSQSCWHNECDSSECYSICSSNRETILKIIHLSKSRVKMRNNLVKFWIFKLSMQKKSVLYSGITWNNLELWAKNCLINNWLNCDSDNILYFSKQFSLFSPISPTLIVSVSISNEEL